MPPPSSTKRSTWRRRGKSTLVCRDPPLSFVDGLMEEECESKMAASGVYGTISGRGAVSVDTRGPEPQ